MSLGYERARERAGHMHSDEAQGRGIAAVVRQVDELLAALRKLRNFHGHEVDDLWCRCGLIVPCAELTLIDETLEQAS